MGCSIDAAPRARTPSGQCACWGRRLMIASAQRRGLPLTRRQKPTNMAAPWMWGRRALGRLLAGAHGAGQTAVVEPVFVVPKREAAANALGQYFQLRLRAGGGVRGLEFIAVDGREIFVVATLKDGLKYVPHGYVPLQQTEGETRPGEILRLRLSTVSEDRINTATVSRSLVRGTHTAIGVGFRPWHRQAIIYTQGRLSTACGRIFKKYS